MELVTQKNFGECGPACLAMITGRSLDTVLFDLREMFKIIPSQHGLRDTQAVEYLAACGVVEPRRVLDVPAGCSEAMLTVPSLNHPGLLHYIVMDNGTFLDPGNGPLNYGQGGLAKLLEKNPPFGGYPVAFDGLKHEPQYACAIVWKERPDAADE